MPSAKNHRAAAIDCERRAALATSERERQLLQKMRDHHLAIADGAKRPPRQKARQRIASLEHAGGLKGN